jgi:hypothetical protein
VFLSSALILAGLWLGRGDRLHHAGLRRVPLRLRPTAGDVALWHGAAVATLLVLVARFQAVFTITATTVIRLAGTYPRWVVVVGYTTGLFLMIVPVPNELLH